MKNRDITAPVPNWTAPRVPGQEMMQGRFVRLQRLNANSHGSGLHKANLASDAIWDYLPYGPFVAEADYIDWVRSVETGDDPAFFAICDLASGGWTGVASFLRINPQAGSIEVGHINFSPALQRTRAATEAMFLMMQWAFEAGYRRYEWKCNAANAGSRRAATRLGLSFEGVFRQAMVVKGRNRDTAWFAAIDAEWPALEAAFQRWLSPENFDADGVQRTALRDLTAPILFADDPDQP